MISKQLLFLLFSILLFQSCIVERNPGADRTITGIRPVYIIPNVDSIKNKTPQEFLDLGNIVNYKSYLYIVENYNGVHLINNQDPADPVIISFISIPGVTQITIDDDILFANFWKDLILIDISNPFDVNVTNTVADFYPIASVNASPQDYFGSFECPDLSKGVIVEWEEAELFDPQCWRN